MNLKTFSVAATIAIFTISFASLGIVLAPHAFAGGDKCISRETGGSKITACSTDKKDPLFSGASKKDCRDFASKCSSSQTGYGNEPNFKP